jgi:NitT/TauT family transport system substrate-binding protein
VISHSSSARLLAALLATALCGLLSGHAVAEVSEIRIATQYGTAYLPFDVMEARKLIEKHAKLRGLGDVTVRWSRLGGASAANDAILSGDVQFTATGVPSLVLLWAKTRNNPKLAIRGVAAFGTAPIYLNTRNPDIHGLKDYTDKSRIAVAAVKISGVALMLEMASEVTFGPDQYAKLDPLTVSMSQPDSYIAMTTGSGQIDSHVATPPFSLTELRQPGIHRVLNMNEVLGGHTTFLVTYTTSGFRAANPRWYAAYVDALDEAMQFINANKRVAAEIYLQNSHDKSTTLEDLNGQLDSPDQTFTTTPQNTMKFANFMYRIGMVKTKVKSWKDLFFPELHHLPGS